MGAISFSFKDHSKEMLEQMTAQVEKALEMCGMTAEGYAKKLCPVDTGLLRNSITHAISGGPTAISDYKDNKGDKQGFYTDSMPEDTNMTAYIGSNVEYAPYVELGSSRNRAQPYMKPAIADHVSQYKGIIERTLKGEL